MRSALWTNIYGVVLMDPVTASALAKVGSSIVSGIIGRRSAKKDLWEQRQYDRQALARLREDAENAGFNPLTVLRAGALSSMNTPGRILPPPAAAFAAQYLGDAIGEAFDKKANEPIEKYNAKIRDLEIKQREADLSISRQTLGQMTTNSDPYANYTGTIPVRVGDNTQQLDVTVAKRMGIKPNDRLTAGDMEEIKGDVWGSIDGAIQSDIWERVLNSPPLMGTPKIQQSTLPKNPPALSKTWFEKIFNQADPNWTRIGG